MNYNIYIIFEKKKNIFFSVFFKNFFVFLKKNNISLIKIIDFGKLINFKKKYNRLFNLEFFCYKNEVKKIFKLFKIKKNIIKFFILLKTNINILIENFNFKKYISKNFKILPCYINKLKFSLYNVITKKIKILIYLSIIPYNISYYLKKINNDK